MEPRNVGYAFVTRTNDKGGIEPVVLTFVGEPRKAFRDWLEKGVGKKVDLPSWKQVWEGIEPTYDGVVDINTLIMFVPHEGQKEVYGFRVGDAQWKAWMYEAEEQDWGLTGSGRRASFIQKLQTWRYWTKKQGADF
jgi:hypothetical protein